MAFYDLYGNEINTLRFIEEYEKHYFVESALSIPRNKTSRYVEGIVNKILEEGITRDDLIFIIAWKIGCLNSRARNSTELNLDIFYDTLSFKTQYNTINARDMIDYIYFKFDYLKSLAEEPFDLFQELYIHKAQYFGNTYLLTLLYFLTKGRCPIYDKYADIALCAYEEDAVPNSSISTFCEIDSSNFEKGWQHYEEYVLSLTKIFN